MGRRRQEEHPNPKNVIAPDLEAAALDHEDLDLVAVEIGMIVTAVIVAVGVAVV